MGQFVSAGIGHRIVIVEDDGVIALEMQRSLRSVGFEVVGNVVDGPSALSLVEQERPDLVLVDIRLPGSMDGIDVARELKARCDVPFIYLTAHDDPETMERAQATEPMGYLVKPFALPDLQNAVNLALVRSALERRLRQSEELSAATLRCIGEAILRSDGEGKITYANAAAERLLQRSASDLFGQRLRDVLALRGTDGAVFVPRPIDEAHEEDDPGRFEGALAGVEERRVVVGTATVVHTAPPNRGLVVALTDVTELLETRQQLEYSARLASLGTLAAGVAHEVNNPLSVVSANVGFALEAMPMPPEVTEALKDAREASTRVASIIAALRDFSHPHSEESRPLDPRQTFGTALHLTHPQWRKFAGVRLELGAVPFVMGSSARLAQAMVTLVINAVQSMEPLEGPRQFLLSSETDARGWAVLSVSDEGPGLSPDVAQRMFDPFFTTRAPGHGTGLGLSIARSIVENHEGQLTFGTPPSGRGARFSICLPPTKRSVPSPAPLVMWWVGPSTPASARLCADRQLELGDDLTPTIGADLLLLNVDKEELSRLHIKHPDLDIRGLLVDEQHPPPGMTSISTSGLSPADLIALVRRGH